ncbi:MAG: ATP-binding protein [Spirochaetia bacterium]|jgi:two-component system sensor histidine kinase BaeS|nr:ATP-binding protein [Spirochaetia bacterium]
MARRLLLSYLILIGVTIVLMSFIINQITSRTFSTYLSSQAASHSEMLPVMLTGYYINNGSWEGVQPDIAEAGLMIGAPITLTDKDGIVVASTETILTGQTAADIPDVNVTIPVIGEGDILIGRIYVQHNISHERADEAFLRDVTCGLIIAGLMAALLAAVLGVLLTRSISRPMAEMGRVAVKFANGDYTARVVVHGKDEVAVLGKTFNQMAMSVDSVEQLRRELVANVSHDLRTPLTVIRGYLEGLRSGRIADRRTAETAFEAMHSEVSRLLYMVGDLRQAAAMDNTSLPLSISTVAAADFITGIVTRVKPLILSKGIVLDHEVAADLSSIKIDSERMGQVLINLLENAVDHTPRGGTIRLFVLDKNEHISFIVEDNGSGILEEDLSHIFKRFYRADPARNPSEGGLGLGLSISKSIVEAHGGSIKAESEGVPGKGSIFTVDLPIPESLENL